MSTSSLTQPDGTSLEEDMKPPFLEIPDGVSIAHWFVEEGPKEHGCEGIDLYRGEGREYCYLWITSTVDMDMNFFWLLDIRTAPTGADFDESRDFLFVASMSGRGVECEWFNRPVAFLATGEAHQDHLWDGLGWFRSRIFGEMEFDAESRNSRRA